MALRSQCQCQASGPSSIHTLATSRTCPKCHMRPRIRLQVAANLEEGCRRPLTNKASTQEQPVCSRRAFVAGVSSALVFSSSALPSLAAANNVCLINTSPTAKANANAAIPRVAIGRGLFVSRIIKGCWPNANEPPIASKDMGQLFDAGVTTFDMGDLDNGRPEVMLGKLLKGRPADERAQVQVLTKLSITDASQMATMNKNIISQALAKKTRDLGSPPELVQLFWGTWQERRWLDAVKWLADEQAAGRFRHLGLTNFDAAQLQQVLDAGIEVASVQVPVSLVDQRADTALLPLCRQRGIRVLAQASLAGGLLNGTLLGTPEKQGPANFTSMSGKYGVVLRVGGQWAWLQELLGVMKTIADKHKVTTSAVALRWVLDKPGVAALVRPARGTTPASLAALSAPFKWRPDGEDRAMMNAVLEQAKPQTGGVYDYERGLGPYW